LAALNASLAPLDTLSLQVVVFTPLKTLDEVSKSTGIVELTTIFSKFLQEAKALLPIEVTDPGMIILHSLVQLPKEPTPIEVTEFGMSRLASLTQSRKAQFPIEVTESGIVMLLSVLQL